MGETCFLHIRRGWCQRVPGRGGRLDSGWARWRRMRFGPQLEVTGDAVHACVTLDGTLHAEMTAHADVFVKDWDFALLSGDFFKKELYSNCPDQSGPPGPGSGGSSGGGGGGSGGPPPPASSPWSVQSTPEPNPSLPNTAVLADVSCVSTSSCVAVGSYQADQNTTVPLVERWDGSSWQLDSAPAPAGVSDSSLYSVSCTSPSACTAVGYATGTYEAEDAFAEVWNGSSWQLVTFPDPAPGTIEMDLSGVSCTSAAVCTAVGWYSTGSGRILLVERQDGTSWSTQTPPSVSSDNQFTSVSCVPASRCTAVGTYYTNAPSGLTSLSFAETWDGSQWSAQATPSPPDMRNASQLQHVSCTAASACTAVGFYSTQSGLSTLAERWDGTSWTIRALRLRRSIPATPRCSRRCPARPPRSAQPSGAATAATPSSQNAGRGQLGDSADARSAAYAIVQNVLDGGFLPLDGHLLRRRALPGRGTGGARNRSLRSRRKATR